MRRALSDLVPPVRKSCHARRKMCLDGFITGYRQTARKKGELRTAFTIPTLANGAIVKSYKVSKRKVLDILSVSGGFRLELNGKRRIESIFLAYGGMAEVTKRASTAEAFPIVKPWTRETVWAVMPLLDRDFTPISDVRSSTEFRCIAARNLLPKFWLETHS